MTKEKAIKIFENKKIRTHWDDKQEKWYFSIVDVVSVLTQSTDPSAYWRKLKQRLKEEGNETVTNCHRLKMIATDGKMRFSDVADTEQLFRLIQSIPSPKAEPFKQWLAKVGSERIDEMNDPEIGIERIMETYLRKGYSKEWINQRLKSIEIRKELTDEWEKILAQKQNKTIESKFNDYILDINDLKGETKVREIKTRVNQNVFRQIVLSNYNMKCAIANIDIPELLIASHIIPWSINEKERLNPENGICLSPLYDKALDIGLIGVNNNYEVVLSNNLKQNTTKEYYLNFFQPIEKKKLNLPHKYLPKKEYLEWHMDNIFNK